MKQFKNKEEFNKWINESFPTTIETIFTGPSDEEIISKLKEEGYDLYDLTADGHAYKIGKYENNGWIYRDEADLAYIEANHRTVEIRDRKREV